MYLGSKVQIIGAMQVNGSEPVQSHLGRLQSEVQRLGHAKAASEETAKELHLVCECTALRDDLARA